MNSILLAANEAFDKSLGKFMLDPDLLDLISGGVAAYTKCDSDKCGDISKSSCGADCTEYKVDCVACP